MNNETKLDGIIEDDTSVTSDNNPKTRPQKFYPKCLITCFLLIFIVLVIAFISSYLADFPRGIRVMNSESANLEIEATDDKDTEVNPTPIVTNAKESYDFPSSTGDYKVVFTDSGDHNELGDTLCKVEVFDSNNELIFIDFDFETVPCFLGRYDPVSFRFIGWVSPTSLLFEEEPGRLTTYSINGEHTVFSYDDEELQFWTVNAELNQWVFQRYSTDDNVASSKFEILDALGSKLRDDLIFENSVFIFTFDQVNNGYFIVSRTFSEAKVSYVFEWLAEETLELSELGTIINDFFAGRGCYEGSLLSVPGEIVYKGLDCFILPSEYHEADEIRFMVPED